MNSYEEKFYNEILKPKLDNKEYTQVKFERVRIILVQPDSETKKRESTYTPDFYCIGSDGSTTVYEIKGLQDEADRLKIKLAAEMFPEWTWIMCHIVSKAKGTWRYEEF